MKKYLIFLLAIVLVACSGESTEEEKYVPGKSIPFEIVKYMDTIAPIYMQQVPHIAYAENEEQFEYLRQKFQVTDVEMDMDQYFAAFIVTQSDSCGIVVDGVYDNKNKLSVQLLAPQLEKCDVEPISHTFVIQVDKADYEKVQLYNGNIMKSSMDVK